MRHELKFDERDLSLGADAAILAMDGKMCRADAICVAQNVFESFGMTRERADVLRYRRGMRCPSCGVSQWAIGRKTAECVNCGDALPLDARDA